MTCRYKNNEEQDNHAHQKMHLEKFEALMISRAKIREDFVGEEQT